MTIDSLAEAIRACSPERDVQRLAELLIEWKSNDQTIEGLESLMERFIGNVWISTDSIHNEVYSLWSTFRDESIRDVSGMTINERLYAFGLLPQFDSAINEAGRKAIYEKLLAHA